MFRQRATLARLALTTMAFAMTHVPLLSSYAAVLLSGVEDAHTSRENILFIYKLRCESVSRERSAKNLSGTRSVTRGTHRNVKHPSNIRQYSKRSLNESRSTSRVSRELKNENIKHVIRIQDDITLRSQRLI